MLIESLGFKKKKLDRVASIDIYINDYLPSLKIEHDKEKDEAYLYLEHSDRRYQYIIGDINNIERILKCISHAYYDKGYKVGQKKIRKDIANVLDLDKLIHENISKRMDNLD